MQRVAGMVALTADYEASTMAAERACVTGVMLVA
jgi:hypothetical protein